jgi:hypothetical protein
MTPVASAKPESSAFSRFNSAIAWFVSFESAIAETPWFADYRGLANTSPEMAQV